MHSTEVGVTLFKAETLQCKVSFNSQTLQSLHLKLTANPDFKDNWTAEELQVIERYFDAKVKKAIFLLLFFYYIRITTSRFIASVKCYQFLKDI